MILKAEPVCDTKSNLGEGPVWHHGSIYWIDILEKRIHMFRAEKREHHSIQLECMIGSLAPRTKGGFVAALEKRFSFVDPESGSLTSPDTPQDEMKSVRFNDGKCDPQGRFWAGTMGYNIEPNIGNLYMLDTDGSIHKKLEKVTISNGICWTSDSRTMYYIDTPTREVAAFDFELSSAEISNRRPVIRIAPEDGLPDGMTIDRNGNLWVALWAGGSVCCYNPNTGEKLEQIRLPVTNVTSCTFGGKMLDELYITTARAGLDEKLQNEPLAGCLFKVRLDISGFPAAEFGG